MCRMWIGAIFIIVAAVARVATASTKRAIICIGPWTPAGAEFTKFISDDSTRALLVDAQFNNHEANFDTQHTRAFQDDLHAQINTAAEDNKNVFVYEDILSSFSEEQIDELKTVLENGKYEVTIVWIYHEMVSHLNSKYAEDGKHRLLPTKLQYYFESPNEMFEPVRRYADAFGSRNVVAVNFHGLLTNQIDLAHVVFCEIGNILCDTTTPRNGQAASLVHKTPEPQDTLHLPLVFVVLSYAAQDGCIASKPEQLEKIRTRLSESVATVLSTNKPKALPLTILRQPQLVPLVSSIDTIEESFYAEDLVERWHYWDAKANSDARRAVEVQEIQTWSMELDPVWQQWFRDEVAVMREFGKAYFSGC